MAERTCADCGADISDRHGNARRCGPCQREHERQRPLLDRTCTVCGASFRTVSPQAKACSPVCTGKSGHPGDISKDCIVCGKTFTISRQYDSDTCSRPCLAWTQRSPGEKPVRNCLWCGDSLEGKALRAKWCNQRCWHAMDLGVSWERIRDRRCIVCTQPIPRSVYYTRVVCSSACGTRNRSAETLFRQTHARRKNMDAACVYRVPRAYIRKLRTLPCSYCGGQGGTADHVVPISRGGKHAEGNLVPACRSCNSSKADLLLIEWRIKRGGVYGRRTRGVTIGPRQHRAPDALLV